MFGEGLGGRLGEFEADEPVAGGAVALEFGGGEFPAAGGLEGEVGEISAGAGGIEFGGGDGSSGFDVDVDGDADFSLDGGAGFFRDVGQDLIEDFSTAGRGTRRRWRVGGWKSIGAQGRGGGNRTGRGGLWRCGSGLFLCGEFCGIRSGSLRGRRVAMLGLRYGRLRLRSRRGRSGR